jgi:signal peptidase I
MSHSPDSSGQPCQTRRNRIGLLIALAVCLLVGGGVSLLIGTWVFAYEPFRIPSTSMAPSIPLGSHVIVKKWGYGHYSAFGVRLFEGALTALVRRGDVLVFDYPGDPSQQYIKRVVGLPGDTVSYQHRILGINGRPAARKPAGTSDTQAGRMALFDETLDGQTYRIGFTAEEDFFPVELAADFAHRDACVYGQSGVTCVVPPGNYYVTGDNRDQSADSRFWGFVPARNLIGKVVSVF